jgi:hypothetical protein
LSFESELDLSGELMEARDFMALIVTPPYLGDGKRLEVGCGLSSMSANTWLVADARRQTARGRAPERWTLEVVDGALSQSPR